MSRLKYLFLMLVYVGICISAFNMLIIQQDDILRKYFIEAPRERIKEYNSALSHSLYNYFIKENAGSSLSDLTAYLRKYGKTSLFETKFIYKDKERNDYLEIGKSGIQPVSQSQISINKENLFPVTIANGTQDGYLAIFIKDTGEAEHLEGLQRYRMFSYSLRFLFFTLISSLAIIALYHNYSSKMRLARDMAEIKASNDGLTGLYTHAYFIKSLEIEMERSTIYHTPLGLVMLDVDRFKGYNDEYGHVAGDKILQEVARVIKSNTRSTDICARYGGEEFSIVVPSVQALEEGSAPKSIQDFVAEVEAVSERIRKNVEEANVQLGNKTVRITISMGVSFFHKGNEHTSSAELLERADASLYKAKETGRNKVVTDTSSV